LKNLFCKFGHWILLIVIGSGVISNFFYYKPYTKTDVVALTFGVVGVIGLLYFAIITEKKKREKQ
jgi:hypothetical protein